MRLRRLFRPLFVGVDIQPDAVRLVRIEEGEVNRYVDNMVGVSLQPDVFNGEIVECWEGLLGAMTELVLTAGVRMAATAVNYPVRLVDNGIRILEEYSHPEEAARRIREGVDRDYLAKYVNCIRCAGLKPAIVDLDILARQRALQSALVGVNMEAYAIAIGLALRR